jgi:hypothetical protein
MTPTPYEYQQHRVGAINRANIAQIPDAAHQRLQRGGVLTSQQEAEADEAIRRACDQLRPAKERPAAAVETVVIAIKDCGI